MGRRIFLTTDDMERNDMEMMDVFNWVLPVMWCAAMLGVTVALFVEDRP